MEYINTKLNNITISSLAKTVTDAVATVVFIHGFPFDKSIWHQQLESLPSQINGIAYDIRGFGTSSPGHRFYSIDLFAKDLLQLISKLGLNNCVLCGISMGGYIALRAMELTGTEIKGLVLCDTNCIADGDEAKLKRFTAIEQIQAGDKADFTAAFLRNVFCEHTQEHRPDLVDHIREVIMNTSNETICAAQLALASRTDTSNSLRDIKAPTLILRGEDDKIMTEEHARQLATIPGSELVTIPDSGHLPNLENAEDFNSALNAFLHKHFLS